MLLGCCPNACRGFFEACLGCSMTVVVLVRVVGLPYERLVKRRGVLRGRNFSRDNQGEGASMTFSRASAGFPQTLAFFSSQSSSFLINVLRIVSNFLMAAVRATFFALPSPNRRC